MFEAIWTGSYPCLCHGEWKIFKNGKDVSNAIPKEFKTEPMNTFGKYRHWFFDKDWSEHWESYESGLTFTQWENKNSWIEKICNSHAEKEELYKAIQSQDWRHYSCGGCI